MLAPQPADELISVYWSGDDVRSWRLVDPAGKVGVSGDASASSFVVRTGTIPTGAYLLQLLSDGGAVLATRHVTIAH
jgi:hypothetical protein